jgi:hypothetical protein
MLSSSVPLIKIFRKGDYCQFSEGALWHWRRLSCAVFNNSTEIKNANYLKNDNIVRYDL